MHYLFFLRNNKGHLFISNLSTHLVKNESWPIVSWDLYRESHRIMSWVNRYIPNHDRIYGDTIIGLQFKLLLRLYHKLQYLYCNMQMNTMRFHITKIYAAMNQLERKWLNTWHSFNHDLLSLKCVVHMVDQEHCNWLLCDLLPSFIKFISKLILCVGCLASCLPPNKYLRS